MMSGGQWIVLASIAIILSNMVCEELMKNLEMLVLTCELESFNNISSILFFISHPFSLSFLLSCNS